MEAPATAGAEGIEITGLCYDSRRARRGDLFFGLSGLRQDGQAYVRQALAAGAVAAVVGRDFHEPGLPLVQVEEPRRALARAAARFCGDPSRALTVVGVTGTNGKTTTTWMLEAVFRAAGRVPGVLGTTGVRVAGEARPSAFTTPEAPELQGLLREMRERGVEAVALELSSHALAQRRCYALECDVAVFTNLSHDHLDYHGTLEAYLDAKLMLFDGRNNPRPAKRTTAVVNLDDPAAERVCAAAAGAGQRVVGFGRSPDAAVRIAQVSPHAGGLDLSLEEGGERTPVRLALLGRFNAWNAAGAFAAARALGIEGTVAARGLAGTPGVPGRLERIAEGQPFEVVVDYAHTPDALQRALAAVREHARGRVLVVFGCGGDRDRAKRPVMGRAARAGADQVWVTSDNPRSEDPAAIAAEIVAGAGGPVHLELERSRAIARALEAARPGDAVLIAGKGHETTQTIGDRVLPFDDREVARGLLRAHGGSGR
ncbi:MAG: UDP-N-acetylmuramoyl-L-alanyl-D-glutamate--2,6-diaminopimelate ligase [Candidatus Eisenbacteria bacterium]|nr:UDP-N-acetylmuramoyl-L-alanyl-D-glutamate--2,6-diaminopimelate ligase [Candidatus Eisenbacteria bacterium]